jgi:hypothetical protein
VYLQTFDQQTFGQQASNQQTFDQQTFGQQASNQQTFDHNILKSTVLRHCHFVISLFVDKSLIYRMRVDQMSVGQIFFDQKSRHQQPQN